MKKIFILDDKSSQVTTIKETLKGNYKTNAVSIAQEFYDLLNADQPDLFIIDFNMATNDGIEVLNFLKSHSRFANIPIILLVNNKDKATILNGINLGASDFLKKPFTDDQLINSIENLIDPDKIFEQRPIVLAVDDMPSVLESINYGLSKVYKVFTLPKPENTEQLLHKIIPDIFLLDYQMPVINGFELVPIIRKFPDHKETPILYLTTEGTVNTISSAIKLGACDFILKPADEAMLKEKIAQHIVGYKKRRLMRMIVE